MLSPVTAGHNNIDTFRFDFHIFFLTYIPIPANEQNVTHGQLSEV